MSCCGCFSSLFGGRTLETRFHVTHKMGDDLQAMEVDDTSLAWSRRVKSFRNVFTGNRKRTDDNTGLDKGDSVSSVTSPRTYASSASGANSVDMKIKIQSWDRRLKHWFKSYMNKGSVASKMKSQYGDDQTRRVKAILVRSDVRSGNSLEDHYEFLNHLGSGKYGAVERWRTRSVDDGGDGQEVAVKKISWQNVSSNKCLFLRCLVKLFDKEAIRNVENELRMFLELDNPFIVKGREWFEHAWKGIFFVMEYLEGESLQGFLDNIIESGQAEEITNEMAPTFSIKRESNWQTMRRLFNHMCYAISYMHAKNIIHRDLKPDNVMLVRDGDYTCVKLIDFGLSEVCHEDAMGMGQKRVIVGTLTFMSPELLMEGALQTKACDLWAMGVILSWMVSTVCFHKLLHPWSPEDNELDGFISPGGADFFYLMTSFDEEPAWNKAIFQGMGLDADFYDCMDGIVEKDPALRWTSDKLLNANFVNATTKRIETMTSKKLQAGAGSAGILGSIKTYANLSKFDQAILSVMAEHISPEQVMNIQRTFRRLDTKQNGKISQEELLSAFSGAGVKLTDEDFEDISHLFDGGRKSLDYSEWVATEIGNAVLSNTKSITTAFWALDSTGTGNLNIADLEVCVGMAEATLIFSNLKKDPMEDSISYEEFKEIVADVAQKRCTALTSCGPKDSDEARGELAVEGTQSVHSGDSGLAPPLRPSTRFDTQLSPVVSEFSKQTSPGYSASFASTEDEEKEALPTKRKSSVKILQMCTKLLDENEKTDSVRRTKSASLSGLKFEEAFGKKASWKNEEEKPAEKPGFRKRMSLKISKTLGNLGDINLDADAGTASTPVMPTPTRIRRSSVNTQYRRASTQLNLSMGRSRTESKTGRPRAETDGRKSGKYSVPQKSEGFSFDHAYTWRNPKNKGVMILQDR